MGGLIGGEGVCWNEGEEMIGCGVGGEVDLEMVMEEGWEGKGGGGGDGV